MNLVKAVARMKQLADHYQDEPRQGGGPDEAASGSASHPRLPIPCGAEGLAVCSGHSHQGR